MPKVSIIISVHNAGSYLIPMLDSVIHQTFTDLEIFLIDDGSTDGSREILKKYEKEDNRITTIFREKAKNERFGQKYSADLGRSLATGEYIMMLDHDDEMPLDAIEKLYNYTDNGTIDVVQGCSVSYNEKKELTFQFGNWIEEPIIINDLNTLNDDILALHLLYTAPCTWACLIRNEFQKNIELSDYCNNDTDFTWKLKIKAKNFIYIPDLVYIHHDYIKSDEGLDYREKYWDHIFGVFDNLKYFLDEELISRKIWNYFYAYKFLVIYSLGLGIPYRLQSVFFKRLSESIYSEPNISYLYFTFGCINPQAVSAYAALKK